MRRWTDADLIRAATSDVEVRRSPTQILGPQYLDRRPLAGLHGISPGALPERLRMPMSGVLAATRTPGPPFYYFTEDALEHFPALAADIAEAGPFVRTPEHCLVSLWLGQAGVGAHAHYDAYDNVFVQLAGRKRFIIAPPDAWRVVRPFPLLHPSHAQAQRDVLAAGALAETSRQIPVWVIDLEPGDILFVPPFCWHHVVSLTANRSVNLWSLPPWAPQTDNVPGAAQRVVGGRIRRLRNAWKQLHAASPEVAEHLRVRYAAVPGAPHTPMPVADLDGEIADAAPLLALLAALPADVREVATADAAEILIADAVGPDRVPAAVATLAGS
jgi:hypothetical protein